MRYAAAVVLALAAGPAAAARDCDPNCDAAWAKYSAITVNAIDAGSPVSASWRILFDHQRRDIRIEADFPGPNGRMRGTIALVGGRVLMSTGLELPRGGEINAVDTPIMAIKLLTAVLGRAVDVAPDALKGEKVVKHRETGVGIRFATPTAEAYLAAPWTADGTVGKVANGDVRYDLHIAGPTRDRYGRAGAPIDSRFTGRFSNATGPVLDDAMPLTGWTMYSPRAAEMRNVGEVRAALEQELNPGVRDASHDFTGLWKQSCADESALQIKPAGDNGMYSVSFCSASGCFDPGTYRPNTFVTGDTHYKVTSDNEIQVEGPNGFVTFQKCSTNPEPTP